MKITISVWDDVVEEGKVGVSVDFDPPLNQENVSKNLQFSAALVFAEPVLAAMAEALQSHAASAAAAGVPPNLDSKVQ